MRRFEYVEGSSAKFWSGFVEGTTFTVLFGRIGTAGQRKDKAFPTEEAARKELDKKIAEKLREGYKEVAAEGEAPAPAPPPEAPRRAPPPPLPPRFSPRPATPERQAAAVAALQALQAGLGGRSWQVAQAARRARRSLGAMAGATPSGALQAALDAVLARVGGDRPRLPLRLALDLLAQLDAAATERALDQWARAGHATVALLREQRGAIGEGELLLRLGRLLSERPERGAAGRGRRWQALRPHLEGRVDLTALPVSDAALKRALAQLGPA